MKTRFCQTMALFTILILTACAPAQTSSTPTMLPTAAVIPSPTQTDTPVPTATLLPTSTPLPAAIPTSIPIPVPTVDLSFFINVLMMAQNYYEIGDFEMYIALMTEVASYQSKPDELASSYSRIAGAYIKQGDFNTALRFYTKMHEADPANNSAPNLLCWYNGLLGKAEEALAYCEMAVKMSPNYHNIDSRGLVYALLGKIEAALADFQTVVDQLKTSTGPSAIELRDSRLAWIKILETGKNPITPEVLTGLRKDEIAASVMPTLTADQRAAPVTSALIQKEAIKVGFTQFTPHKSTQGAEYILGSFKQGSCNASLALLDKDSSLYAAVLTSGGCTGSEGVALAHWLVDKVYPDKNNKARAVIWIYKDLYYLIAGKQVTAGDAAVGQFVLSGKFDQNDVLVVTIH